MKQEDRAITRRFADKVVLVTGAGGGLGSAAMHAFAAEGARLVASDLPGEGLDRIVAELRGMGADVVAAPADISFEADVARAVGLAMETFGRLDVAFNNAGIHLINTPIHETTEAQWEKIQAVSLKGTFLCIKHEVLAMLAGGGGAIVNTASGAGIVGAAGVGAYCAAKHGVVGLTKTAALEYSPMGIRTNAICPGATDTPMLTDWFENDADGTIREMVIARHPIGRIGDPREVVNAVLFLASDAASFITGAILPVDGGSTLG